MSKFKEGEKVIVIKHPTSNSGAKLIGKIGKVIKAWREHCDLDIQMTGVWDVELQLAPKDWDE